MTPTMAISTPAQQAPQSVDALKKVAVPTNPEKQGYNPKLLNVNGEEFSFEEARGKII